MRTATVVFLLVLAVATGSTGCSVTPAERQTIIDAWAAHDREIAAECRRNRVGFAAGGCVMNGP